MLFCLVIASLFGRLGAVDPHRSQKFVRAEQPRQAFTVSASGNLDATVPSLHKDSSQDALLELEKREMSHESQFYVRYTLSPGEDPAEICYDPDNDWPATTRCQDQECANAANYCGALPRTTQSQFGLYTNCLSDVCVCYSNTRSNTGGARLLQDSCNLFGGIHLLISKSISQNIGREALRLSGGAFNGVNVAFNSVTEFWDVSILPQSVIVATLQDSKASKERPCFFYGYSHVLTFDRIEDLNLVTEAAIYSTYSWLTSGLYWLVRDPHRIVSIQARICGNYALNDDFTLNTCQGSRASMRTLQISGRFMQSHRLRIDHRKNGLITFDGVRIDDATMIWQGNTSNQWNGPTSDNYEFEWAWPPNCIYNATDRTGCLVYIKEEYQQTHIADIFHPDTKMKVILPMSVSMVLHRLDSFINVVTRMTSLAGQDGVCGNFDGLLHPEFYGVGTPGGRDFNVSRLEDISGYPPVQPSERCSGAACALWWQAGISPTKMQDSSKAAVDVPTVNLTKSPGAEPLAFPLLPREGLRAWFASADLVNGSTGWTSRVVDRKKMTVVDGIVSYKAFYITGESATYHFGKLPKDFTLCTISQYLHVQSGQGPTFVGNLSDASTGSTPFRWGHHNGNYGASFMGGVWTSYLLDQGEPLPWGQCQGSTDWLVQCGTNNLPTVFVLCKTGRQSYYLNSWNQSVHVDRLPEMRDQLLYGSRYDPKKHQNSIRNFGGHDLGSPPERLGVQGCPVLPHEGS